MKSLADFLNHGTLPFVGREFELERVVALWRATLRSEEMRGALLIGEAGVGKSRLMQEATASIESQGGAVVHVKFYPESTASVAPPLASALWRSRAGRQLLRQEPEETLSSTADALRRFSRLRPTLLIVEDVHLLAGAALREFSLLLEGIAEEPLALLCAARPVELPVRGVLERWPLEELRLQGLTQQEIAAVWQRLFDAEPSPAIAQALGDATLGNALAMRSALLGAIRQEALVQRSDGVWGTESAFEHVVERSARSLTEGMTAHLSREESLAAGVLASLGEVFSREASELLVEKPLLETLIFNGILHELSLPKPPLPGLPKSSRLPLAFTHSLVHHQLTDTMTAPIATLVAIVASGVPIYSILPFRLIAGASAVSMEGVKDLSLDIITRAVNRALDIAVELDLTSDWALAMGIWEVAEILVESNRERWSDEELRRLRARNLVRRLQLLRRSLHSEEYGIALRGLLELTDGALSEDMAIYRLAALIDRYWHVDDTEREKHSDIIDDLFRLAGEFPSLRQSDIYIKVLRDLCQIAQDDGDDTTRRRVEQEYDALMSTGDSTERTRRLALGHIAPNLLTLFDSPDELDRRMEMYRDLLALDPSERFVFITGQPYFLMEIGHLDEMLAVLQETMPQLKSRGMMRTYYNRLRLLLQGEMLLGTEPGEIVDRMHRLVADTLAFGPGMEAALGGDSVGTALILGRFEWLHDLAAEFPFAPRHLPPMWQWLASLADAPPPTPEEMIALLRQPLLRIGQLVNLRAGLRLLREGTDGTGKIEEELRRALPQALDWLAERRLNVVIESLLNDFTEYLTQKQQTTYRKQALQIASDREGEKAAKRGDGRVVITMLGRIEIRPSGSDEPLTPRGARQKSFLGVMVAGEMLARPLARDEFLQVVGIDNNDPKLARDAVNSALYRLREVVGHDVIISDGEMPRLNRDLVRIDLVEVHELLHEAEEAMRRRSLARAQQAALRALDITRGEVPFPTLYEEFFEAMREEIENRLRSTIIDLSRLLLRESDATGAGELLERAFTIMPDDEEVAELYCQALESLGRRAEAERVRWRAAAEAA